MSNSESEYDRLMWYDSLFGIYGPWLIITGIVAVLCLVAFLLDTAT